MRILLLSVGALLCGPIATVAQVEMSASAPKTSILDGQVVDSLSGEPIPGVLVRVDSGEEAFTDSRGRFRFLDLPEGKRLLAFLSTDCRITWGEVTVLQRFPRDVRFPLPPAFGVTAQEQQRVAEERQRTTGRRYDAAEIDKMNASNVLELIRRVAPGMVSPLQGSPGDVSSLRSSRSRSMMADDAPVVVIDGVRAPGAEGVLSSMRPSEVAQLEIQPGAAAGWEYGSSGASGVIKITLRRGVPDGAVEDQQIAQCVVPSFPRR